MRAKQFTDYELYEHYRDSLRDLLDADAVIRELGGDGVDQTHLRAVWEGLVFESRMTHEDCDGGC